MSSSIARWATDARLLSLLDQAIVSGSNFVTIVIIGRALPAQDFGHFSLAFMTWLLLSNLHRSTLTQPLNVLGAGEARPSQTARYAGINRAGLALLPVALVGMAVSSWFFFPDPGLFLAAFGFAAVFFPQEAYRRYCYTTGQYRNAVVNDAVSYGGQVLLLLLLVQTGSLTVYTAFLALAISSLLACVLAWRLVGSAAWTPAPRLGALYREHLPLGRWLTLTVLAVWGAGQVYPFLMTGLGATVVAAFAASRNLLNVLGLVVQSIGNFIPTRAAQVLQQEGPDSFRRHFRRTMARLLVLALLFVFVMQVAALPLLQLFYAGRYDAAAPVLRLLALGSACSLLGTALGAYALALNDSRSGFFSNLGASVMTFTLGIWLVHEHGLQGAALATVLSLATASVLQAGFVASAFRRLRRPVGDQAC